jgi:hypothetical protein
MPKFLLPALIGTGTVGALGAVIAAKSREKKRAENRVNQFNAKEVKDWDRFTDNTARKSFIKQLGKNPMADPKLLQYADNMNRLKTGSKVTEIPGDGGRSYQIIKLRGSDRLGCTCNDWRYKRSVAQPGEEQDCKHIKQYRQMSKTAAATYEEEGSFTHDGKRYSLQEAFRSARTQPTKQIPVDDLKWVLAYDRPDPARLAAADLTAPVLVAPDQQGRPTVVDGLHRLSKAVREGRKTIPAKVLPLEALKTAAASFKDTLPKPVIDGKPHDGAWTIVGSGRLSIPKKTSDIDYMVPLEEVKDLSSFQEYKDVPGVYWRDSETIDGRPSTIVALPRYAYDKIDASYQQATDRFGKRKLRQLKKTLPKDSFYKDIGVIYTSDAMKKEGEQRSLASLLRDADFSKTASIALNRTMTGAAIGGISGGVGGWASGDEQKQSMRNAAVGGAVGAGLGFGAGYAYHKLRPVIGRMRGLSQALDNESPMLRTADGLRVDIGKKSPPKSPDKFVYETPSVRVFKDGDRLGAYVVPITKDVEGRDAPVLVWRTDTKSSPKEFAALALEYAKKHSSVDPAHVRDFEKKGGHIEDRIAERAPGAEAEVNALRAKLRKLQLRKGQTYHVPLSRGKGYAVIGDVGDRHAVKTVLGPNMRPPGERLKVARAPRDYKREYEQYHAKPEQVENRSLRNQARRKLGLSKGDPREVDHKTPLSRGGGNGHSNLRAVSRTTNRTKFTETT